MSSALGIPNLGYVRVYPSQTAGRLMMLFAQGFQNEISGKHCLDTKTLSMYTYAFMEFEPQLGKLAFRRLTKYNVTCPIRFPSTSTQYMWKTANCLGRVLCPGNTQWVTIAAVI